MSRPVLYRIVVLPLLNVNITRFRRSVFLSPNNITLHSAERYKNRLY